MGLLCASYGNFHGGSVEIPMEFPKDFKGMPMRFPLDSYGFSMVLSMIFLWDFFGGPIGFP